MFLSGWSIWCLLLTVHLTACSLEIIKDHSPVICSKGLSECSITDETPLFTPDSKDNVVTVRDLDPQVKLCCRGQSCGLCLVINIKVSKDLDNGGEEGSNSGQGQDDSSEEGSVTVCYKTPATLPTCTKVEFTVNQPALSWQSTAEILITIFNATISFGSEVIIYTNNTTQKNVTSTTVTVPSLDEVCLLKLKSYIQDCGELTINVSINQELKQVDLHFSDNTSPSVCIQSENGICKALDGKSVPLYSVTPCLCFQVWKKVSERSVRSHSCPFKNNKDFQRNVWDNLTVSVEKGLMYDNGTMLLWNVSAPCWLKGEVWACERTSNGCTQIKGFRKPLGIENTWRQNNTGIWEKSGAFEQINLGNFPCVMVKIEGMENEIGPFCYNNIDRWRWSLFAVTVLLLLCLALLIMLCLQDFVKKSVWSWPHGGFVKIVKRGHVLVLSPPDSDEGVSSAVCSLGSLLCSRGLSVTVDQWSRRGQSTSGPLPWSHCQLLNMNNQCDRVVLVLTPTAVDRAQSWSTQQQSPQYDVNAHEETSPYSDVFRACLFAIKAYKNQGRASERFVLVKFDSQWSRTQTRDNELPEVLQGLPILTFPSQTNALLSELTMGHAHRQKARTRGTWDSSRIL